MIVDKTINPERNLYYLGAKIIEELSSNSHREFDCLDVFEILNKKERISISLYSLVLDWLFLLGIIKTGKKGQLEKCF
jgi:hypothetical protein